MIRELQPRSTVALVAWLRNGLAAAVAYQLVKISRRFIRWYCTPLWKLPGPRRTFWLGTFVEVMKAPFMEPHFKWWDEAASPSQSREDVDMIHYTGFTGHSSVAILNADFVKQILVANYRAPRYAKKFFNIERLLGRGLVTLEGEDWHRHRRIIHPSFQAGFLKTSLSASVPQRVNTLIECWKKAGADRPINASSHFSMLTLDILGDVAYAHDFHGMQSVQDWVHQSHQEGKSIGDVPPVSDRLIKAMNASFRASPKRMLLGMLGLGFMDFESTRTRATLNEAVDEVVENARKRYDRRNAAIPSNDKDAGKSSSKYTAKSLLELLLNAKDTEPDQSSKTAPSRAFNSKELRDEVKTFLIAGHETTSTWCYWAVFCMCKHPEIQERLYQDIMKHCGSSDVMDLDTIERMSYFDAFLQEVLRYYSPVGMIIRHTVQEETYGETTIPPNTRLVIPTYLIHRSPRYWKNPDEFLPERWLDDETPYSHPYAYLPFSAGPRNCIGYRFATMEAKLILAPIIRAIRFELVPELRETEFSLTSYITVKAKPTVLVNAKPRTKN